MVDHNANSRDPAAEEIRRQAEDIFREKIIRSRKLTPAEKFREGFELFEWACLQSLNGIRNRYPELSAEEHQRILERRLANARLIDEAGIYSPPQDDYET
jgi:hypothetical protein